MSWSQSWSSETEDKDGAGQEVGGDVEGEVGGVDGVRDVVVPGLLGHHDQPEVDLHEGQGPEDQEDGSMTVSGGDGKLSVPLQRGQHRAYCPAQNHGHQCQHLDTTYRVTVTIHYNVDNSFIIIISFYEKFVT